MTPDNSLPPVSRPKDTFTVDFLNTIFIVMVLYLHHSMYTTYAIKLLPELNFNLFLQKMAVGGFCFLSGYKLTLSKIHTPVKAFIINRFFRIYLLYLAAVICFSVIVYPYLNYGRFPDLGTVLVNASGFQSVVPGLFGTGYLTLWFISFLFLCYIFFLAARKSVHKTGLFHRRNRRHCDVCVRPALPGQTKRGYDLSK